ncbi:MAG: DUF4340 domain-containing protein [Planctomycetota bacterium]
MQAKHVLLLGLVTALAVLGAFWALSNDDRDSAAAERGVFLPALAERLNDVTAVTLTKGDDSVTVQRLEGGWGVVERGGYPAKFESVKALLFGLSQLEVDAPRTKKPEHYAKLGVEDEGAGAASTRVVARAGDATLADVLIGTTTPAGREQTFNVRRRDEAQAWLVRGPRVDLATAPKAWMQTKVLEIDGKRVRSAKIEHPDGEVVRLERAARDSNTFRLQNLPPGRMEKHEGVGNAVATALSFFNLEDVRPASQVDFTAEPRAKTTIRTYDGLTVTIETAYVDAPEGGARQTWARLSAGFEEPPAAPDDADADADAVSTAEEVRALDERLQSWAFQIAEFKADALARRMDELLAEPEPEMEPEMDAEPAPGAEFPPEIVTPSGDALNDATAPDVPDPPPSDGR